MKTRVLIELPLSAAAIAKKVAAWRELFGAEPHVEISGTFRCADGETAFPRGNTVLAIGRRYVTARIDGRPERLDPLTNMLGARNQFLILEEK